MANGVPTLLAKVARLRPRVICFIGKGIWLHVERALRLQVLVDDRHDDGNGPGLVARSTENCATIKEEELEVYSMLCAPSGTATATATTGNADARPIKAEPDPGVEAGLTVFNAETGAAGPSRECDVSRRHPLAVKDAEVTADTGASPWFPPSMAATGNRRGRVASQTLQTPRKKVSIRSDFSYGLQPYKAVHDVSIKVRSSYSFSMCSKTFFFLFICFSLTCVRLIFFFVGQEARVHETLFCVFPSTSGRVVSHQVRRTRICILCTARPQAFADVFF
jgi:hypothetical protein